MLRKRIKGIVLASAISVMIGIIISLIMSGTLKHPVSAYLWNAGYSLSLGLPLFSTGFFYEWFACRLIDWIKKPVKSVVISVILNLGYSFVIILLVNWFWQILLLKQSWESFWTSNQAIFYIEIIVFVVIASIIYASEFFKSWVNQVRETEKIKLQAQSLHYQVLQNQVNPHFLFNCLNVLGSLIDLDVSKAKKFNRELSLFYSDLLMLKDTDIISLKEETDFVKRYVYLQQIRYGEALQVDFIANERIAGKVIPLTLQSLVENAIKHNEISMANPLQIVIAISDNHELVVENNYQPKKPLEESGKTGLKNLADRYRFLTGKEMIITKNDNYFRVSLPLIQIDL